MGRIAPFALVATALLAPLTAQDEASFKLDLKKARRLVASERWDKARTAFDAILQDHAGQGYAKAVAFQLAEEVKTCAFHAKYPTPDPDDLVSGDLMSWSARTGKIKLRYTPATMGDFGAEAGSAGVHPMLMDGPYSVTVRGKKYASPGVSILGALEADTGFRAQFGARGSFQYYPMGIYELKGKRWDAVESRDTTTLVSGKKFEAELKVAAGSIEMKASRRRVFKVKRKGGWGQFGVSVPADVQFDEIVIEGKAQPSWIQGLVDAAMQKKRAEFDKAWQPSRELPAWIRDAVDAGKTDSTASADSKRTFPGKIDIRHTPWLNEVSQLVLKGEYDKAMRKVDLADDDDASELARLWTRAVIQHRRGQVREAMKSLDAVLEGDPDFVAATQLRADALTGLRQWDAAIDYLRKAIAAKPKEGGYYYKLVILLLRRDSIDEAEQVLADAKQAGAQGSDLAGLDNVLRMARNGPSWGRRFEHESRHYVVVSDIDKETCRDASRVLEDAYILFQKELEWIPRSDDDRKFRVYLFSGKAGYLAYAEKILGQAPSNSAGLYSGILKQLLIWNLPNREDMLRTVRHEGLHQYLDRILVDPPIWFNEGLAEFYEQAQRERGRFVGGQLRRFHLVAIEGSRDEMQPVKQFIQMPQVEFMRNAALHYAQGWALVHFLREGSLDNKKIFKSLFEELSSEAAADEAMRKAFEGVDLDEFEAEFQAYIRALRRKLR